MRERYLYVSSIFSSSPFSIDNVANHHSTIGQQSRRSELKRTGPTRPTRPKCKLTIALSEKEKKRLTTNNEANKSAPNKNPRGKGKPGRGNAGTERDAPIEVSGS